MSDLFRNMDDQTRHEWGRMDAQPANFSDPDLEQIARVDDGHFKNPDLGYESFPAMGSNRLNAEPSEQISPLTILTDEQINEQISDQINKMIVTDETQLGGTSRIRCIYCKTCYRLNTLKTCEPRS